MALIEIRGVSKSFDRAEVLKDVDIDVEKGEILALIGPTGSGKTTLLRIIDLLDPPTRGEVYFEGAEVSHAPERERLIVRRRMGMLFQKPVMFRASVRENVAYGLKVRGMKDDGRVAEALRDVGLEGYASRDANTLSGGETQRAALARAIAVRPDVLLLDEPTANLDPRTAAAIDDLILTIARRGAAVVMASHNMLQWRLADTVAVLVDGRIRRTGKPSDLLSEAMAGGECGAILPW